MATSSICGSTGSISGGSEITNWEITITVDAPDATSMSSAGWKERIACLKGATGNFRSLVRMDTGARAGVSFKDASVGGVTISGNIIVQKTTVNTPVDGVVSYTSDFTFTGTVTASTLI